MAMHFRSSLQTFDNKCFWVRRNALLNLINQQDDIDKMYLYAKDLSEPPSMNFGSKSVRMLE